MKKIFILLAVLLALTASASAQAPFSADISVNGVNAFSGTPVVRPGESVTVSYTIRNGIGQEFVMTGLSVEASPPAVEALLDQYLSEYYSKQQSIGTGFHESGSQSIELPGVLPAGSYTATGTVSYVPAGGSTQTYTYTANFDIEAEGLMSRVAGFIVKYLPKSVASKILGLFG